MYQGLKNAFKSKIMEVDAFNFQWWYYNDIMAQFRFSIFLNLYEGFYDFIL